MQCAWPTAAELAHVRFGEYFANRSNKAWGTSCEVRGEVNFAEFRINRTATKRLFKDKS